MNFKVTDVVDHQDRFRSQVHGRDWTQTTLHLLLYVLGWHWNEAEVNPLYLMYTVKNQKLLKTGYKHENKRPDTDTVQYEMATVRYYLTIWQLVY